MKAVDEHGPVSEPTAEGNDVQPALAPKIVLESGDTVHLHQLGLPPELHNVIGHLTHGADGEVHHSELRERSQLVVEMIKHVDMSDAQANKEMIALLGRLQRHRAENDDSIEYMHMSQQARDLLSRWDLDQKGTVSIKDLARAAEMEDAMQRQNVRMRRGIIVLTCIVVLLMLSTFALSYLAVEAAKETHVEASGKLVTVTGAEVMTASADFVTTSDGLMLTRGQNCAVEGGSGGRCPGAVDLPLQVAAAVQRVGDLTSALPDATFQEMRSLELTNASGNRTLQLAVASFQRVGARSSRCGSVVHLRTEQGRLTLDDRALSADAALERHLLAAGFGALLSPGPDLGLGRRLQQTDGMLRGFFNLLRGVEQACQPEVLEPPEGILRQFRATVRVRARVAGAPEDALSGFFLDEAGGPLPIPGYELARDASGRLQGAYRTWTEELLSRPGLEVVRTHSALQPFLRQVRVASGGAELSMTVEGSTGYRCTVRDAGGGAGGERGGTEDMRMEYMGLVEEDGMLLRHFRLYMLAAQEHHVQQRRLLGTLTPEDENSTATMAEMIEAGIMPTHMDYFDVDTDPLGRREPGDPYRVRHDSTVPGSSAFREKTYVAVEPLLGNLTMAEAFDMLNVTSLAPACGLPPGANASSTTDDLLSQVPNMTIVRTLPPPRFEPRVELGSSLLRSYDLLVEAAGSAAAGGPPAEELKFAQATPAWRSALKAAAEGEGPEFRSELEGMARAARESGLHESGGPLFGSGGLGNLSNATLRQRLQAERQRRAEQRGSEALTTQQGGRRLEEEDGRDEEGSAPERRLAKKGKKKFKFDISSGKNDQGGREFSLDLAVGVGRLHFSMETDSSNRVTDLFGYAEGEVLVWRPPKISLHFYGEVLMDEGTISGLLNLEVTASVLSFSIGLGLAIGAVVERRTFRLRELWAQAYLVLNRIQLGGTVVLTPVGCGPNYYKRWEVDLSLQFVREGRRKRLSFDYDIPLYSTEIGPDSGCVEVHMGSSWANTKCVDWGYEVECGGDSGAPGVRLGGDSHGDDFEITQPTDNRVCARRTDADAGWGLDLRLACYVRPRVELNIGRSENSNSKCISTALDVACYEFAAHPQYRARENHYGDTFSVTQSGSEVCVRRTDSSGGWGLDLRIYCTDRSR